LPAQKTGYCDLIAVKLQQDRALVPPLWQLELAMRHGLPLATQDVQLKYAAIAAGLDVVD